MQEENKSDYSILNSNNKLSFIKDNPLNNSSSLIKKPSFQLQKNNKSYKDDFSFTSNNLQNLLNQDILKNNINDSFTSNKVV